MRRRETLFASVSWVSSLTVCVGLLFRGTRLISCYCWLLLLVFAERIFLAEEAYTRFC